MRLRTLKWVIVTLFVFSFGLVNFNAIAQTRSVKVVPENEDTFRKALTLYVAKNYNRAFVNFESLSSTKVIHQRTTATLLMTGKSLYKLNRYLDAIPYFDRLISGFSKSKYLDDAFYGRSTSNYKLHDYFSSVEDLLWIVDNSSNSKLVEKSKNLALQAAENLTSDDFERLLRSGTGESSAAVLTIAYARSKMEQGSPDVARTILNNYKQKYRRNQFTAQIDQLLSNSDRAESNSFKIGVVLPLSGYFSEEGLAVLHGIKFAQEKIKNIAGRPVELVVRDSESNLIQAIHHVETLIDRENVTAIIGELESQVTAGIGALASAKHVPVIGPAATENGVASVAETVFQLNSDLENKGRALAEYAINEMSLKTFATLAPTDDYGQQMVASFSSAVDELGGRIVAQRWYNGRPEDLGRQFKSIRETAFHFDSTDVDSLILKAKEEDRKLEEYQIPVNSIDGFFFPFSFSDDIKYIAPQLALHNINTQILSGEYLHDLDVLQGAQVQKYINGAIFISDYFPDENSRDYRTFRTEFRLKAKKSPERWEVYGFDAFSLITKALKDGATSGADISGNLSELSGFNGKKGVITFRDNNRVNREVNILQFINGNIVKHHKTVQADDQF